MSESPAQSDPLLAQPSASEDALRAVLQSRTFARAEKLQRFLKFVAEMTFRGDAALVHEHLVAVDVFDRGDDYSPGEDSVVRRQAHALRRKLKDYYDTEGQSDPVQIELPVGTYVPVFRERRKAEVVPEAIAPLAAAAAAPPVGKRWPLALALVGGAVVILSLAFWSGWLARSRQPLPLVAQPALSDGLREIWGIWLEQKGGVALCFSNPATASVRQFGGPIEPNPEHQGVPVTDAQDLSFRRFFRLPAGGSIYLYPVMAQAKMGEALASVLLTVFFTRAGLPVQSTQSRFMTWDSMRKSNTILMGNPDSNPWVAQVLRATPFGLAQTDERRRARILNRNPKAGEQSEYFPTGTLPEETKSYALVSFLPGVDQSHEVLVIGGLDTSSTTVATDFLLSPKTADSLLAQLKILAPGHKGAWHFQAILETDVRDTVALKASVVALRVL